VARPASAEATKKLAVAALVSETGNERSTTKASSSTGRL
jgi:hypothetical protein